MKLFLQIFTVTCVTSVTDPNIGPFEQIFKKINVTLVTQVTVRFGNGGERSVTVADGELR